MSEKVFLTGISGWIAKHTAIELLNSGYEVLGTVRNNNLIEQTKETLSKYTSIDKLSFVELDLLKDDGWNEAAKECKYIMHVASPFPMKVSNNRNSLLPVGRWNFKSFKCWFKCWCRANNYNLLYRSNV